MSQWVSGVSEPKSIVELVLTDAGASGVVLTDAEASGVVLTDAGA